MSHEFMGMNEDHAFNIKEVEPENNTEMTSTDPRAEDKIHEQREQEKLDAKYSTASMLKTHECFNCDKSFSKFEALESGVSVEYSETYCSANCMNSDTEQMAADKVEER